MTALRVLSHFQRNEDRVGERPFERVGNQVDSLAARRGHRGGPDRTACLRPRWSGAQKHACPPRDGLVGHVEIEKLHGTHRQRRAVGHSGSRVSQRPRNGVLRVVESEPQRLGDRGEVTGHGESGEVSGGLVGSQPGSFGRMIFSFLRAAGQRVLQARRVGAECARGVGAGGARRGGGAGQNTGSKSTATAR